ncbi:multidrug DMT transporter permease [Spirosoma sp. KCTC 42546]|uniref:GRP family sugar transporter n=1 Tax=Spirosoma sp. KCTC 42546 TaxID=2520506 RepID=UPI0011598EA8|nr:GRP family sugar transporter [Spirosoma sp. KCTC 42546]QDK82251.1 multidrug DMT transporter permease [Spirosoma sp. KCTC 42546]
MFIITYYPVAVVVCFLTMLCWGSWANTQKLATQSVPTTIFYRDYTYGILLLSLILAFTFGSFGDSGRSFLSDIKQGDTQSLLYALAGGFVFNIANILIVVGIELAGLSVAMPVGIGLALILGVVVNYILSPIGNVSLLSGGVFSIFLAVVFSAMAYRAKGAKDGSVSTQGLVASLVGGFLMSFFFYFVAKSMTTDFARPASGLLTPYTALVLFALGVVVSTPLFLPILRRFASKPADGDIFYSDVSRRNHRIGMLGGMVWCLGMASSLLASGAAGYAISYGLGQGATIIAVLWGVCIWHEFRGAPTLSSRYLVLMGFCYVLGLVLIISAK